MKHKCDNCIEAATCNARDGDTESCSWWRDGRTNGDRLRQMTNEELAKALSDIWFDKWPGGNFCPGECDKMAWDSCVSCILIWLNKAGGTNK